MRRGSLVRGVLAASLLFALQAYPQPKSEMVHRAQEAWRAAADRGVDFGPGPCLGMIAPDWVADVVHVPRAPIDNRPDNQCAAYREGKAKHFVELDRYGNLVRVQ